MWNSKCEFVYKTVKTKKKTRIIGINNIFEILLVENWSERVRKHAQLNLIVKSKILNWMLIISGMSYTKTFTK